MEFKAPGRIEICGNHTDHQHGCVLTASVDLYCKARVKAAGGNEIIICSQGFEPFSVSLDELDCIEEEKGTSKALVKGIAKRFSEKGRVPGFEADITSDVLPGSGLSSSAAFEVLIARIINELGGFCVSDEEIAVIAQYAENVYYGKPCGLMDQMAGACRGMLFIDFADPGSPQIERLDFDFEKYGYEIAVVDSHIDHADLTDDYASIPREIGEVCKYLGHEYLRDVDRKEFDGRYDELEKQFPSRALQRCIHVFEENRRVETAFKAAKQGDIQALLAMINESGESSEKYLQNITPSGADPSGGLAAVIGLCRETLRGRGAVRVHGGGFAGTVLCIVPLDMRDGFFAKAEAVLGRNSVHFLNISQ